MTRLNKKTSHKGFIFFLIILVSIDVFIIHIFNADQASAVQVDKNDVSKLYLSTSERNSLLLDSAFQKTVAGFKGSVDVALYNDKTGTVSHYSNTTDTFNTASIIKLSILEEVLVQDQASGEGISDDQLAEAEPMIENSDNDAASALWDSVGGPTAMEDFYHQIGAASTTTATDWGLTQTTALDQLKVLNALAYPGKSLSSDSASTADNLLDQVEADQTWGVSGGVPSNVSFELKDGWLPDADTSDSYSNTDDWTVNSIGHIYGDGVDYTMAVLTDGNDTEQDGITNIESLATAAWNTLSSETK
jgi:beta-lactamase class A